LHKTNVNAIKHNIELYKLKKTMVDKGTFNKKAQLSLTNPRHAKACPNCSNSTCL